MEKQNHFLALLLILGTWPGASTTQAAIADAVVAWGDNYHGYDSGHTTPRFACNAFSKLMSRY